MEDTRSFVLINGKILTMNYEQPEVESLIVQDGRILHLGSNDEVLNFAHSATRVMDLRGKTVIPGLIDNHCHFLQTGLALTSIDLLEARSIEEVLTFVEEKTKLIPPGNLIRGFGYDDYKFPDYAPPNRWHLDQVAPKHPVWLNRVDFHSTIVNSQALRELQLPPDTNGVDLDEKGIPTGILREDADRLARKYMASRLNMEDRRIALDEAVRLSCSLGTTTVCAMEGGDKYREWDLEYLLNNRERTLTRLEIFPQTLDIRRVMEMRLPRIGGCILVDGSFGSWTAALMKPYSDDRKTKGVLYFSQSELNSFIFEAHVAGLQVSLHVIGDRAIDQALKAFEFAHRRYHRKNTRHRIEHFELPTKKQIAKARRLGLIISSQPGFEYYWGGKDNMYGERLGSRVNRSNPFRSMIDAGLTVAGGSDAAVTPMNLMIGVHAAVNRVNVAERITVQEALEMFTINGAKAIFAERERGSLEKGKLADMVVLEENPLTISPETIKDVTVMMTIIGGKIVYGRLGLPGYA